MISQHDIDAFDNMRTHYIFDVDGTLTPSRGLMDPEFSSFFYDFCCRHNVYLVTGSDKPKTVEQLGNVIFGSAQRVYNCSGSDVYEGGINVHRSDWTLPEDARDWLNTELDESDFSIRTGNHIEERPGMVNFSVVGRNATLGERKLYVEFDTDNNERNCIVKEFNLQFPELDAKAGGETGIDISPKGSDKSQIMRDFSDTDFIYFFGDRMDKSGNDRPLADVIKNGKSIHVKDWRHTYKTLLGMV
jgi:phosphomannomutase